jgi:hypothetical protein
MGALSDEIWWRSSKGFIGILLIEDWDKDEGYLLLVRRKIQERDILQYNIFLI